MSAGPLTLMSMVELKPAPKTRICMVEPRWMTSPTLKADAPEQPTLVVTPRSCAFSWAVSAGAGTVTSAPVVVCPVTTVTGVAGWGGLLPPPLLLEDEELDPPPQPVKTSSAASATRHRCTQILSCAN